MHGPKIPQTHSKTKDKWGKKCVSYSDHRELLSVYFKDFNTPIFDNIQYCRGYRMQTFIDCWWDYQALYLLYMTIVYQNY